MTNALRTLSHSRPFQQAIVAVTLVAAVLVGLETSASLVARHGPLLHALDQLVLWIFVAEAAIKIGAEGRRPWRYFADGWNVFDFAIVAVCFLPVDAHYVTVLRLARLLRVLKLVHVLPRLQVLVGALLRSIPSMGYVGLLLGLLFYVYGVAGTFLFGPNDPVHFGSLSRTMLSLFQIVTLEGWTDLMRIQMVGCDVQGYADHPGLCTAPSANPTLAVVYFVSFIFLGTMIMLNLFIGVIMNGMSEAQSEHDEQSRTQQRGAVPTLADELHGLREQLAELTKQVSRIERAAARAPDREETPPEDTPRQKAA